MINSWIPIRAVGLPACTFCPKIALLVRLLSSVIDGLQARGGAGGVYVMNGDFAAQRNERGGAEAGRWRDFCVSR